MPVKVLILSDNHGYSDASVRRHAAEVDEIWHAGDWLTAESADELSALARLRSVFGNVDGHILRKMFPEEEHFEVESVKVSMRHIAGYPRKYNAQARAMISRYHPDIVVCGHSHILKIMKAPSDGHLHINPGAYGLKGFHTKRTMVRLDIEAGRIFNIRVIEQEK